MPEFNIKADLTPANFDNLIERHGQYVRWIRRQACYCVTDSGRVDPHHKECEGRGWIADIQRTFDVEGEVVKHAGNFLFPKKTPVEKIKRIYRKQPFVEYDVNDVAIVPYKCKEGTVIKYVGTEDSWNTLSAHQTLYIDYDYTISQSKKTQDVTYLGSGILEVNNFNFDSKFEHEILNAYYAKNVTTGETMILTGFSGKYVFFKAIGNENPAHTWEISIEYALPHTLAIQGEILRMKRDVGIVMMEGDAFITVPYNFYIGNGDVITALVAEERDSQVIQVDPAINEYELKQFDVTRVLNIEDETNHDYKSGVDYIITKRNVLKFLPDGIKPNGKASLLFLYHPTYTSIKGTPQLRTPENERFPKRLELKLWAKTGSERKNLSGNMETGFYHG